MRGLNMPGRGTTPTWPRRAEGGDQGPRVTTGHPELPGPAHTVCGTWYDTAVQLLDSCQAADVRRVGRRMGPRGPSACAAQEPGHRSTCHSMCPFLGARSGQTQTERSDESHGSQERSECARTRVCPGVSTDSSLPRTSGNPAAPAKGDSCAEPRSRHTRPADAPDSTGLPLVPLRRRDPGCTHCSGLALRVPRRRLYNTISTACTRNQPSFQGAETPRRRPHTLPGCGTCPQAGPSLPLQPGGAPAPPRPASLAPKGAWHRLWSPRRPRPGSGGVPVAGTGPELGTDEAVPPRGSCPAQGPAARVPRGRRVKGAEPRGRQRWEGPPAGPRHMGHVRGSRYLHWQGLLTTVRPQARETLSSGTQFISVRENQQSPRTPPLQAVGPLTSTPAPPQGWVPDTSSRPRLRAFVLPLWEPPLGKHRPNLWLPVRQGGAQSRTGEGAAPAGMAPPAQQTESQGEPRDPRPRAQDP